MIIFQRIGAVALLSFFLLNTAMAFESQGENIRLDTMKSLTINRSMIARFESEFTALSRAENLSSSDRMKRELLNLQYKIKALDEDNEKLMKMLPESLQANEFLKNMPIKTETEKIKAFSVPAPTTVFKERAPLKKYQGASPKVRGNDETNKLHERALEFVAKKEMGKAIKIYEEIVLNDPNDDEAYLIMGHCLVLIGQFEKGEEAFQNAAHINPQNLSQIIPFYENRIRENSDDADAYANLGFICLMFGNTRRAQASFQQSLSLDSGNPTALRGLQVIENQENQSH